MGTANREIIQIPVADLKRIFEENARQSNLSLDACPAYLMSLAGRRRFRSR